LGELAKADEAKVCDSQRSTLDCAMTNMDIESATAVLPGPDQAVSLQSWAHMRLGEFA
jgi:hypothetical protein